MASKPIVLDNPIKMKDVLSGQAFTFQANFEGNDIDEDVDSDDYDNVPQINRDLDNLDLEDEPLYQFEQILFSDLEPLMTNVDKDGMVKKRIFHQGKGNIIPENSKITYHYKAYLELEAFPFDSTYNRKKPDNKLLTEIIYGLSIAISSMRVKEKAQFLIKPEWAYGVRGNPPRIPANQTILFEVQLLNFVEVIEKDMVEMDSTDFDKNYDKALKLCAEAKNLIQYDKKDRPAIRNYNEAINLLSKVYIKNEEDEAKYVDLLIRLYTNLAITHNRLEHWTKCCLMCKEVYKLCNTFYRQIDAKVNYNHAKALFGLGDLNSAEKQLRRAAKEVSFDRPDVSVMNLYKKIQGAKAERAKSEKDLAHAMFKNNSEKK